MSTDIMSRLIDQLSRNTDTESECLMNVNGDIVE